MPGCAASAVHDVCVRSVARVDREPVGELPADAPLMAEDYRQMLERAAAECLTQWVCGRDGRPSHPDGVQAQALPEAPHV